MATDFTAYAKLLLKEYPVRLKRGQKDAFLQRALDEFTALGYPSYISDDKYIAKNRNLIAGSIENAKMIFTAHYDTPYRMLIGSNTIFPRNLFLSVLASMPIIISILIAQIGVTFVLLYFGLYALSGFLPLFAVIMLFYFLVLCFTNKYNVNDNSSGVLLVFSIAKHIPKKYRQSIAFVLFDNEEKGLLGSYAFKKNYKKANSLPLINFDCVGVGNEIRALAKNGIYKDKAFINALEASRPSIDGKNILVRNSSGYIYPSDQIHFKKGLAVAAFKAYAKKGLYINNIHNHKDTRLDDKNIFLLTEWFINFIGELK